MKFNFSANGTLSVTGVPELVLAASTARKKLAIKNTGNTELRLTAGTFSQVIGAGALYETNIPTPSHPLAGDIYLSGSAGLAWSLWGYTGETSTSARTAELSASRSLTLDDSGIDLVYSGSSNITLTPIAGLARFVAVQSSTGTVTVTGATGTASTSSTSRRVVFTEVSPGVYQGDAGGGGSGASAGYQALGSKSGAFNIDCSTGSTFTFSCGAAVTPSFTNTPASGNSQTVTLEITAGNAGVTWPAGTRWLGAGVVGSAPTLSSGTDLVAMKISNNAGTLVYTASYLGRAA